MAKTYFERLKEIERLKKAEAAALYDRCLFETAIVYQDKKPIKAAEKAARTVHYFRMKAAAEIIEKIRAAGIESLTAPEYIFIKSLYNNSISEGSGKLKEINSISTAVFLNKQCIKNAATPGSICAHCYAARYSSFRPALARKLELNTLLYNSFLVPVELLPGINALYFRLESFGDLNSALQFRNYLNIVKKNPAVKFAIWTKNPQFMAEAFQEYEKPNNLQIVYSALKLNAPECLIKAIMKRFWFIDRVFIVYDKETIKKENIQINCGGRSCINCLNCYKKGGPDVIREKKK